MTAEPISEPEIIKSLLIKQIFSSVKWRESILRMSKEKVVDLIEKPVSKSYVSAGIYVFNPSLFEKIKKNEHLDMTVFINRLLKYNY